MVGIDRDNPKRQGFAKIDDAKVMGVVMTVAMVAYNMAYKIRIRNISKMRQSDEFATIKCIYWIEAKSGWVGGCKRAAWLHRDYECNEWYCNLG